MRKIYITAILIVAIGSANAQKPTKHIPPVIHLTLTAQQVLRLDSAIQFANSSLDSKRASQWFMTAFAPVYNQVEFQMLPDSLKVVKPVKK